VPDFSVQAPIRTAHDFSLTGIVIDTHLEIGFWSLLSGIVIEMIRQAYRCRIFTSLNQAQMEVQGPLGLRKTGFGDVFQARTQTPQAYVIRLIEFH
jgi:hypothetical protein